MHSHVRTTLLLLPLVAACSSSSGSSPLPEEISLATNALTSTTVQVDWTDVSGATVDTYEVFADGVSTGTVPGSESTVVVTDLSPDETHCFEVRALSGASAIHTSNEACTQTFPDAIPSTPPVVTADAVSPAQIDLSWSAVIDDFGPVTYWVLRDGVFLGFSTATTFQDVGLLPNTTYSYTIRAEDSLGQLSPPTAPVSATTPADLSPPSVSTGLTARLEQTPFGERRVVLDWDFAVDDGFVVGYRVERDGTTLDQVQSTSFVDLTFLEDVQHCYRVFPVDTAGNEPPSSAEACLQTGWELDSVAQTGDLGRNVSLIAVDEGRILVMHGDGAALGTGSGLVLQSAWGGSGWSTTFAELGVLVESSFDLARGPGDEVHLAALRRGPSLGLVHAELSNDVWQTTVVDTDPFVGIHPSIDVAADGRPAVAYLTNLAGLRFADEAGGSWPTVPLSGPGVSAAQPALTMAPDGSIHLLVALLDPTRLVHVQVSGLFFDVDFYAPTIDPFVAPQSAWAPDGSLHVVFRNMAGRIQHGRFFAGSWSFGSVSPPTVNATLPHLAIADDGTLHVAYFDVGHTALVHAVEQGGLWLTAIVDDEVSIEDRVRIDVGDDGSLAMAYRGGSDLKVARRAAP